MTYTWVCRVCGDAGSATAHDLAIHAHRQHYMEYHYTP